jgi:deoxyribodipyrimidine photo-lyase
VGPSLVWFRQDLRLGDHPALRAAVARGAGVIPVYVLDDEDRGRWVPGAASRWWLHRSLESLDRSLRERGLRLVLARGPAEAALDRIAAAAGAGAIFWNRLHEPALHERDERIRRAQLAAGREVRIGRGGLLFEPEAVANREGGPFQVFGPFWRRCLELEVDRPRPAAKGPWPAPARWPESLRLGDLGLRPAAAWDAGLADTWTPGEAAGALRLRRFAAGPIGAYADLRDRPGGEGTSALSPWLHFGEVGPRQVWEAVRAGARGSGVFPPSRGASVFLAELGWREFAHHLLWHYPATPESPLRPKFARFPWAADPGGRKLRAWQKGRTGYPIVDAGMRQLWRTGWMHNRARMIAASFLVKHLRLPWTEGAAWFWDTLVDADLANNTLGWQWCAGCGADAAPYFRIFSPVRQALRFDPDGAYVRRWVPELARLPDRGLRAPWEAPPAVLAAAGVELGRDYPRPVVDHFQARAAALAAFRRLA